MTIPAVQPASIASLGFQPRPHYSLPRSGTTIFGVVTRIYCNVKMSTKNWKFWGVPGYLGEIGSDSERKKKKMEPRIHSGVGVIASNYQVLTCSDSRDTKTTSRPFVRFLAGVVCLYSYIPGDICRKRKEKKRRRKKQNRQLSGTAPQPPTGLTRSLTSRRGARFSSNLTYRGLLSKHVDLRHPSYLPTATQQNDGHDGRLVSQKPTVGSEVCRRVRREGSGGGARL